MASIKRRTLGDGSRRYDVVYRNPENRQRRKTFSRKVDAERFATTTEADKLRGAYIDHSDRTTVAEYARRWRGTSCQSNSRSRGKSNEQHQ